MIDGLRREIGRRVFRGRVRLGDGAGLGRITPDDLDDLRRRFPLPKFFVLGHARSGTSFLARLLRAHPEVHCEWQTQFFSERGPIPYFTAPAFRAWLRHPSNKWVAGWEPTPALLRACLDTILERGARQAGKRIVGDKSPNENADRAVRWISALYPDGRLIYIVRDGRDTILSKRIQAFIDQPESLGRRDRRVRQEFMAHPQAFLDGRRSIFTEAWLESSARGWADAVGSSVAAGQELLGESFRVVRYEDFLEDPLPPLARLWEFLGAAPVGPEIESLVRAQGGMNPEAEWHAASASGVAEFLPRGVRGAWRRLFTAADVARFDDAAGNVLETYGYLEPT
jgi:hypothetical protein